MLRFFFLLNFLVSELGGVFIETAITNKKLEQVVVFLKSRKNTVKIPRCVVCTQKGKMKVCEKHFFENDVIVNGSRKRLVSTAIPSSSRDICKCTEQLTDPSCLILGVS